MYFKRSKMKVHQHETEEGNLIDYTIEYVSGEDGTPDHYKIRFEDIDQLNGECELEMELEIIKDLGLWKN